MDKLATTGNILPRPGKMAQPEKHDSRPEHEPKMWPKFDHLVTKKLNQIPKQPETRIHLILTSRSDPFKEKMTQIPSHDYLPRISHHEIRFRIDRPLNSSCK